MRLLPIPTEGLHPALPSQPPPLVGNTMCEAPSIGGMAGCLAFLASLVTRRRPHAALYAASLTTCGLLLSDVVVQLDLNRAHREFLKSHGIRAPRQQLAERVLELDRENVIFAAGLAGVMLGLGRMRPGGWMSRWCRITEHKPVSTAVRTLGSFSFGAYAGTVGLRVLPLPGTDKAILERWRDEQLAAPWRKEVEDFERKFCYIGLPTFTVHHEQLELESAMQDSLRYHVKQFMPAFTTSDEDKAEPRPHQSELVMWQRRFMPSRNLDYQSKSISDLQDHLEQLQAARVALLPEAELIWHKLAQAEAAKLPTLSPNSEGDELTTVKTKTELKLLSDAHSHVWTRIGDIDWMIADTNKQILQFRAKEEGRKWEPSLSAKAENITPNEAMWFVGVRLLADMIMLEEMQESRKALPEQITRSTSDEASFLKELDNDIKKRESMVTAGHVVLRDLINGSEDDLLLFLQNIVNSLDGEQKQE